MTLSDHAPRILVVEDSDEDFAALQRVMRRAPTAVCLQRSTNADDALELLAPADPLEVTGVPALVVLDLNLPGRDGRYVLREMRARHALRRVPVVIFSTSSRREDVEWCYENGANAYHVKGVDYEVFKRAVESFTHYWISLATLPPREGRPSA